MSKRVRFAPTDERKFCLMDKPISHSSLNSFGSQPLGYCLQCNNVKYATAHGNRCMNCFVPKSAIKKNNLKDKKSTQLFSKSAENLNTRGNREDRVIHLEFPNARNNVSNQPKSHEFENINENLYNRYADTSDFKFSDRLNQKNHFKQEKSFVWKCQKCAETLHPGEIAISAEHANPLARWHPKCFCCVECNELLQDLLYYNHDDQIYCEKHYMKKLKKPKLICAACDEPIKTNEYVKAEEHHWHKEHFVCWDCDSYLAGKKYIVSDSKPYCLDCHTKSFSKKCSTCNWTIPPDSIRLTYENIDWHASPNCFKCFACHTNLLESQFLLKNSLLFCSLACKKRISVI